MRLEILDERHTQALSKFLHKHLQSSLFICSNIERAGLRYNGAAYSGEYFALLSDDGAVLGTLVHCWNGNLLMQCPDEQHMHQLSKYFLQHCSRPITGFNGVARQADICINALELEPSQFTINRDETLMHMALDTIPSEYTRLTEHLHIGPPVADQAALLKDWLVAYELEAFEAQMSRKISARVEERVQHYLTGKQGWLLFHDKTPVAFSGFNASYASTVQVGPVWTPPERRNKGYARRLVAATLVQAASQGLRESVLFTDNPAAYQAYAAIGFKDIGKYKLAFLREQVNVRAEVASH